MASRMASTVASSPALRANYDAMLELARELLGFDPMILVNVGLVLGAVAAFLHYTGQSLYRYARRSVLSSVHINEDDQLYDQLMRYVADTYLVSRRFRSAKATTPHKTTWEDEEDAARAASAGNAKSSTGKSVRGSGGGDGDGSTAGDTFDPTRLISYRTAINRVPVRLAPFEGSTLLRHRGSWILFSHNLHRTSAVDVWNPTRERGYITLRCLGRSLAPVQRVLADAQEHALERSRGTTRIFRGMSGLRGDRVVWQQVLSRPARDIRTVILDRAKKGELLADINEYLHPHSRRWYANRGIPYRRGYLFSGVPGMGKTSLTAALAGVFGLDIYVLSLLDTALTESHLMRLLGEVPSRCIVLLEDVDAAGLNRPGGGAGDGKPGSSTAAAAGNNPASGDFKSRRSGRGGGTKGTNAADAEAVLVSALGIDGAAAAAGAAPPPASSISLSGLLNAIDGVSSHEGHILIMTTNNPDQLDRALVRPGRVDMHIDFQLPRRPEIRALFVSMYRDLDEVELEVGGSVGNKNSKNDKKIDKHVADEKTPDSNDGASLATAFEFKTGPTLAALADRFAAALPEQALSLATIQGFLLRHKYSPRRACDESPAWAAQAVSDAAAADDGMDDE